MLRAENQVIERNIDHLPSGNVLLVDILDDDSLSEFEQLRPDINWFGYTPFFDTWQKLSLANKNIFFSEWLKEIDFDGVKRESNVEGEKHAQLFDAVVIYFPKTKLRFDYYLSMISKFLTSDATIYVVGEKKGGVKNCAKALSPYTKKANKLDAARHCMMFTAAFNQNICAKNVNDWYQTKQVNIDIDSQSLPLTLYSLPGVFSASGVDEGTQLLLKTIEPLSGKGLDFGCGCGVISASVSKAFNCEMLAIDVDALAVASSNKTFEENEIQAKSIASNGLSEVIKSSQKFDFIVTNPPFHTGISTDYSITENLIKQSLRVLNRSYQYWMVANSFLPYAEIFTRHIKPVVIKNKNNRFNIYKTQSSI